MSLPTDNKVGCVTTQLYWLGQRRTLASVENAVSINDRYGHTRDLKLIPAVVENLEAAIRDATWEDLFGRHH
jgi:hypothetical protein